MLIREMSRDECLQVLAETKIARLACAFKNQPYVVPVYLAYFQSAGGESCLYGFTTLGQKVEWMRANPLVCVEVDKIDAVDQWVSVVVFGQYQELPVVLAQNVGRLPHRETTESPEELPIAPALAGEQLVAYQLLQSRAMWWEPATTARAASVHRHVADPVIPIFYKIGIDQVTGHQSTRDTAE